MAVLSLFEESQRSDSDEPKGSVGNPFELTARGAGRAANTFPDEVILAS